MKKFEYTERPRPRPKPLDHDGWSCGESWEYSCDECRKKFWPERFFTDTVDRPAVRNNIRPPFLSQQQLIKSMHYYRHRAAVKYAMLDLLLDDLVELIDSRIQGALER